MALYPDGMLMEILRPLLAARSEPATAVTLLTGSQPNQIPYVHARAVAGGRDIDPRFGVINTPIQVDCYASDRPSANQLALDVKQMLVNARERHTPTQFGSITQLSIISPPVERREQGQLDGVTRWTTTYSITAVE